MERKDQIVLERMLKIRGAIDMRHNSDTMQVFPGGDRRRRAGVFWVQADVVQRLLADGALEPTERGYTITPSLAQRMQKAHKHDKLTKVDGQHYDTEEQDVFIPGGSMRKAAVNHRSSALERLARRRDSKKRLILTPAEVEAGRRLARDYAMSGIGSVSTQNYLGAGNDGDPKRDGEENKILSRMTARTRLMAARSAMGEGIDRPVIAVCCREESLESVERAENWAKKSGLSIIKIGLGRLVKLYGTEAGKGGGYA